MRNVVNWTLGSFFRTLGRFLFYILIGSLLTILASNIGILKPKAASITPPNSYFKFNNSTNLPITVGTNASGTTYPIEYAVPDDKYIFLIIDTCTQENYANFSVVADSCNNSCFQSGTVTYYKYGTCSIGGYGANSVLLQLKVKKFQLMPETTYYRANNNLKIVGYNYSTATIINSYYGSDNDELTLLASGQKNIDEIKSKLDSVASSINSSINSATSSINNAINNMKDFFGLKQDQTNSKLDQANQKQDQANQKLDDLNKNITDDSVDDNDLTSKASQWSSKSANDNVVSNLVTMPITLINAYISGLNGTCSPYNLGNLFGTDLIMPCINISSFLGSSLWGVIDILFSGFMIYAIAKKLVKIFNDFTNLKDNQVDELYGGGN